MEERWARARRADSVGVRGRRFEGARAVLRGRGLKALVACCCLLASTSAWGQGSFNEVAGDEGSEGDGEVVGTENPDALTVGTENPNSMVVNPSALPNPVESQSPDAIRGTGVSPDSLTVGSEPLTDSPPDPGGYQWGDDSGSNPDLIAPRPQSLAQAKAMLRSAQARLDAANTAVGDMMRRDYPTGKERILLYDKKQSAQRDVAQAQKWVADLGGPPAGNDFP